MSSIGTFKREQLSLAPRPNERLVLSLTQPWASLIVTGEKQYETRGWRTNYRGPILIHASKAMPKYCRDDAKYEPFASSLKDWLALHDWALGHIIGEATVVDYLPTRKIVESLPEKEVRFGNYGPNRWAWKLENPRIFSTFVPARGSLGLWRLPKEIADQINQGDALNAKVN